MEMLQSLWTKVLQSWRAKKSNRPCGGIFKKPRSSLDPNEPLGTGVELDNDKDDSNDGESENSEEESSNKDPLPYNSYQPLSYLTEWNLPVKYWFYVYLYSNEGEKLLRPFNELQSEDWPRDRRLLTLMIRCKVRIFLSNTELYKSLPRHIIVLQGPNWKSVVRALVELEDDFPQLMRFASHPMLMNAGTFRFSCTGYRQTALLTRVTRLRNELVC